MPRPNLFLTYVTDTERSTAFYGELFEMEPVFTSPRYVAFEVAPGVLFAVWSGRPDAATPATPRTSEVGLMVPGEASVVDDLFRAWKAKGVTVVDEPYDEPFGRTFVVADPDGNLIRVSPTD
ncbi:VOC family protein [Nocardioides alcanivorans]|uniref:VOC family protein n=1 Tax=Nocardioides alcanivorans TaxID=2897352 RepID=UPI001F1B4CB9|nr:VOC family protein [Nocardioides alcanivorans]